MYQPGFRSFAGTVLFLAYVLIYVLIAMGIGARYLADAGGLAQFVFYLVAGLAWLPGAMWIVWWMAKAYKKPPQ